jgi:hypothetical protein
MKNTLKLTTFITASSMLLKYTVTLSVPLCHGPTFLRYFKSPNKFVHSDCAEFQESTVEKRHDATMVIAFLHSISFVIFV